MSRCHAMTEVIPGLFLGGWDDAMTMVEAGVDVLVPLDSVPWPVMQRFGGEVWHYTVPDGGRMPRTQLEECVDRILRKLEEGRKVGVFCIGGHGRTGYLAACVVGRKENDPDPIATLRRDYCRQAVETREQLQEIARYLDAPYLVERYRGTVSRGD